MLHSSDAVVKDSLSSRLQYDLDDKTSKGLPSAFRIPAASKVRLDLDQSVEIFSVRLTSNFRIFVLLYSTLRPKTVLI